MSQPGSESKEEKQYLSSVKIERSDTGIIFSFNPAVPTEEISNEMQDYFGDDILDKGGDVEINEIEGKSCITQIVIPKSFARKIILGVFRNLEKEGICALLTENDLDKSRKSGETLAEISARRKGTRQEVQTAVAPVRQQKVETAESREAPRFGVQARVTDAEKRNNDVRMNVDAYLYIGSRNNNRDYARVEPVIFEYNGVQKELITSRIGKIRNRTLVFREAFESRVKLRVWPKAFPDEVIEITVNPWEARPTPPTPPAGPATQAGSPGGGRTEVTRNAQDEPSPPAQGTQHRPPLPPDNDGDNLAREVAHEAGKVNEGFKKVEEKRKAEFAKQKTEFEAKLKEAEQREEALKTQVAGMEKRIEELDEKKRKEAEEKARLEKEKAEAEEKIRLAAEEQAKLVQAEKERQEQELKRIGNVVADYLIYEDVSHELPAESQNTIQKIGKKLREGEIDEMNKKLGETLLEMQKTYTPEKVDDQAVRIKLDLLALMSDIGIDVSPLSKSMSWAYRDMVKQTYLLAHPREAAPGYGLGNPMEDPQISQRIVELQFGDELYRQCRLFPEAQLKIEKTLQGTPFVQEAHDLFARKQNKEGTLSPIELEKIGAMMKTCLDIKTKREEANQEYEEALKNGTEMKAEFVEELLLHQGRVEIKSGQILAIPKGKFEVQADVYIEHGGELRVEGGTQLLFGEEGGIVSRGSIKAKGSANEQIVFAGISEKSWKNVTIEGGGDNVLEHCVIKGGGGRVYTFDYEKNKASVDATGKNPQKNEKNGGGLACVNGCSNTVLKEVKILGCNVGGDGGGIWSYEASPELDSVDCISNQARYGGGIYIAGGDPKLTRVICQNNTAKINGGGMCIAKGSPTIDDCTFESNTAENGGGVSVTTYRDSLPAFAENTYKNNTAKKCGGGIYLYLTYHDAKAYHPEFLETKPEKISGNKAKEGGGCYVYHEITKKKYEGHKHDFRMGDVKYSQNTPDSQKEDFRSTEPAKHHGH